jgi:6-phosphogluconate dehydrogenase (decarboxylating)
MDAGDIIDGGNSYYRDDPEAGAQAARHIVIVGAQRRAFGLERGYV